MPCSQAPLCFCQITHLVISKPTAFRLFQLVWHFFEAIWHCLQVVWYFLFTWSWQPCTWAQATVVLHALLIWIRHLNVPDRPRILLEYEDVSTPLYTVSSGSGGFKLGVSGMRSQIGEPNKLHDFPIPTWQFSTYWQRVWRQGKFVEKHSLWMPLVFVIGNKSMSRGHPIWFLRKAEVIWRLGQRASLAPLCSNLRSFRSKSTVRRKYCDIVGTFRPPSQSFGTRGIVSPCPHRYVPVSTWQESVPETLRKLQEWSLPIFLKISCFVCSLVQLTLFSTYSSTPVA